MSTTVSVIYSDPPNRSDIAARFGDLPDTVIFSYAPDVYIPSGTPLTPPLAAHESVHIEQQGDDPDSWWDRYLRDDDFRLEQEVEAHRAEWRAAERTITDRNAAAREKIAIARRLASPLYGSLVTVPEALRLIARVMSPQSIHGG